MKSSLSATFFRLLPLQNSYSKALILLIIAVGWKKTFCEILPKYPGLLLMPSLTNFTFGPVQPSETCLCGDSIGHCRTGQLGMSYDLSWINICISSMAFLLEPFLVLAIQHDPNDYDIRKFGAPTNR